jgi:hypothetical protein
LSDLDLSEVTTKCSDHEIILSLRLKLILGKYCYTRPE